LGTSGSASTGFFGLTATGGAFLGGSGLAGGSFLMGLAGSLLVFF